MGIVQDFRAASKKRAVKGAGFDGVEVHGADGCLMDQLVCAKSNHQRTMGHYAGTNLETRSQFLKNVLTAVTAEIGVDRVGLRISPLYSYQGKEDV